MKHIIILILLNFVFNYGLDLPIVQVPNGLIEGEIGTTIINKRNFFSFEGVPYARPPIGKYKFKEAQPLNKPWEGIWKANTIHKCLQYNHFTNPGQDFIIGDENCLYLNIYTPIINENARLDVIVYIHGGAFMFNYGAMQRPEILLDNDLVYVNFNYRLGPLGFLTTEDNEVPGNNGIKDQILALKWIKSNIHYFGGNSNSITIVGMSAGGASVHLHYLTRKSHGLFNKGISQSGTALNPWVIMENGLDKTKKLSIIVGCPTNNGTRQMINCLKQKSGRQIVSTVKYFQPWLYNPFSPFGVVVDNKWSIDPVLDDHPYHLIKNGLVNDLPWIASITNSEGLYPGAEFYFDDVLQDIDQRWNELMPFILDYNYTIDKNEQNLVSEKIRSYYFNNNKSVNKNTFMDLIQLLSDRLFINDIVKTVKMQSTVMNSSIYFYYFTYRGAHSSSERLSKTNKNFGASHADDTSYVFRTSIDTLTTENDRKMTQIFQKIFTTYANSGVPEVENLNWTPINELGNDKFNYLKISSPQDISLTQNKLDKNINFWESLPLMENEKLLSSPDNPPPVIETPLGKVSGFFDKTINGRIIYSFEGIPYAKPPTGKNRFKEPLTIESWQGTWKAIHLPKCLQFNKCVEPGMDYVTGDEDCLYLSVYTPNINQDANLDVIVYIHGGAFMFTHGGALGPQILLEENVVYVKINYRLGPLGFLSTEDKVLPGNNGLKDQIMALKWIQNNIKYFGGNPNSVTITGMSAGGASVHLHYLIAESENLFHKGHSQSGTALNPWILMENSLEKTKTLSSILGCSSIKSKEIVECLKQRSARKIVEAVNHFQPWSCIPFSPFGIVVDKWATKPILSDHPYNLLKNKLVSDKPWIVSFTNSEGLYPVADFYNEKLLEDIDTKWDELAPLILDYNYTLNNNIHKTVNEEIRKFYFKNKKINMSTFMQLIQMASDRLFIVDIEKAARMQANANAFPVYSYYFTYRGSHSQSEFGTKTNKDFGASHGDDTSYILKIDLDMLASNNDKLMSKILVNMLVSFAKNSTPEVPITWSPVSNNMDDSMNYLKISSPHNMQMGNEQLGNRDFWNKFPFLENENLFPIKDEF